jgi:signal transduction histidine kinase
MVDLSVVVMVIADSPEVRSAPGMNVVTPEDPLRRCQPMGLGAGRRAPADELRGVDRAAIPTIGVRESPSRNGGPREHTAGMSRLPQVRGRTRHELLWFAIVLGGLIAFVGLTFAVIVIGGSAAIGRTASPSLALSVVATAVVALAFDPVQTRLEYFASRTVKGGDPAPYDVLRRFSGTRSQRAEELPARMAQMLAEGTGARWAQVWLVVDDRPTLAATWPPEATDDTAGRSTDPRHAVAPGRRTRPVLHGGQLLGVLVVQERDHVPLTTIEERLFAGLAGQAGLVLRGASLRTELEQRAVELSARADELRLSRERVVDAQDAERRRLERDIHDGAQQHLVALAVNLRLAATLAETAPDRADALLAAQADAATEAKASLVRLSRGIYPPLLEESGIGAALRNVVAGSARNITVVEHEVGRFPAAVETAAYFSCLEALQNAAKHSGATTIQVTLDGTQQSLKITVEDDGVGFDAGSSTTGAGLANIRDRVESVGGSLRTESAPGRGTRVSAELPRSHP